MVQEEPPDADFMRRARRIVGHEDMWLSLVRENAERIERLTGATPALCVGAKEFDVVVAKDGAIIVYFPSDEATDKAVVWDRRHLSTPAALREVTDGSVTFTPPSHEIEILRWSPNDRLRDRSRTPDVVTAYSGSRDDALARFWNDSWQRIYAWRAGGQRSWSDIHAEVRAGTTVLSLMEHAVLNPREASPEDRALVEAAMRQQIDKFMELLDRSTTEEELHQFLAVHPMLVQPDSVRMLSKMRLGSEHVVDLVIERPRHRYVFIELENARARLFTKSGDPARDLGHALRQVEDWLQWLDDYGFYARSEQLEGLIEAKGVIVMGRANRLSRRDERALKRKNSELRRIEILTYDDLVAHAETLLENLSRVK